LTLDNIAEVVEGEDVDVAIFYGEDRADTLNAQQSQTRRAAGENVWRRDLTRGAKESGVICGGVLVVVEGNACSRLFVGPIIEK
jgi:hypothetical protein